MKRRSTYIDTKIFSKLVLVLLLLLLLLLLFKISAQSKRNLLMVILISEHFQYHLVLKVH